MNLSSKGMPTEVKGPMAAYPITGWSKESKESPTYPGKIHSSVKGARFSKRGRMEDASNISPLVRHRPRRSHPGEGSGIGGADEWDKYTLYHNQVESTLSMLF